MTLYLIPAFSSSSGARLLLRKSTTFLQFSSVMAMALMASMLVFLNRDSIARMCLFTYASTSMSCAMEDRTLGLAICSSSTISLRLPSRAAHCSSYVFLQAARSSTSLASLSSNWSIALSTTILLELMMLCSASISSESCTTLAATPSMVRFDHLRGARVFGYHLVQDEVVDFFGIRSETNSGVRHRRRCAIRAARFGTVNLLVGRVHLLLSSGGGHRHELALQLRV